MQNNISKVTNLDLCIACGACINACPKSNIRTTFSKKRGCHEVSVIDASNCLTCNQKCLSVCPSMICSYSHIQANDAKGEVLDVMCGYSPALQNDGKSSSGGILGEILHFAVKENFLVVALSEMEPNASRSVGLDSLDAVKSLPGSVYHSVNMTEMIPLIKSSLKPVVVVGLPCHLEGLENWITKVAPEIKEKIFLKVGLMCGWSFSWHSVLNFFSIHNVPNNIETLSYRGDSKVGSIRIKANGEKYKFSRRVFHSFNELIAYRTSFFHLAHRLRCRVCQNHMNFHADIVVGDAWLKREQNNKSSLIIVRTPKGQSVIRSLHRKGDIELRDGSFEDIEKSQSMNLVYGYEAATYRQYLASKHSFKGDCFSTLAEPTITLWTRVKFEYEFFLRNLFRSGKYKLYRILSVPFFLRSLLQLGFKKICKIGERNV